MRYCRLICLILCIVLFGACSETPNADPSITASPTESMISTEEASSVDDDALATEEAPSQDALSRMRDAISEVTSYTMEDSYMAVAIGGFKMTSTQVFAQDGSFHFVNDSHQWIHTTDEEFTQNVEYYYRYEDGILTYYSRLDGGRLQSGQLTEAERRELDDSYERLISADALFPSYLENFALVESDAESGLEIYTFALPVEALLSDAYYHKTRVFIENVLYFSQCPEETDFTDINVYCTVWVSPETGRPVHLRQDYTELKPYVLTDGALSAEYALNFDAVYLDLVMGYEEIATMPIPPEFLAE